MRFRTKALFVIAAALSAAPLAAAPSLAHLPGVSDRETNIPYGDVQQVERGHGDVLFVRGRTDQWYRVALNTGCLRNFVSTDSVVFRNNSVGGIIDRFSIVELPDTLSSCAIASIRESAPPPQVDSHSPVTLD